MRAIYAEGIATREATFETELPSWRQWDAGHLAAPRLVGEADAQVQGWSALSPVSRRRAYRGVAEVSVYVDPGAQRKGLGGALLEALVSLSEKAGFWTLQGGIFAGNTRSLRLFEASGFRVVGRRERLGCLDGVWRDVVLVERRSSRVGVEPAGAVTAAQPSSDSTSSTQ